MRNLLTDERGSISTKRVIALLSALFLCITLLANSFTHQEIAPSDKLVDAVMAICIAAMGSSTIDKFTWGISDRGASIRVPQSTANEWKGYVEDRRPSSNADPYKIIYQICESLKNAETIDDIKHKMNYKSTSDKEKIDFKTFTNEELLEEYMNDDNYELDLQWIV